MSDTMRRDGSKNAIDWQGWNVCARFEIPEASRANWFIDFVFLSDTDKMLEYQNDEALKQVLFFLNIAARYFHRSFLNYLWSVISARDSLHFIYNSTSGNFENVKHPSNFYVLPDGQLILPNNWLNNWRDNFAKLTWKVKKQIKLSNNHVFYCILASSEK